MPNLTGTAKIDVKNNSVTVDYSGAGGAAAAILAQLTSGYNGGAWNGAGINTSSAIVNQTALGWKDDPASQSLFIKYTRYGDADLSGTVDTIDFNILVANFSQSGKVWNNGDFNYSGTVDTIDFNLLASNFAQSVPAPALGGLVPEPASLPSLIRAGCTDGQQARIDSEFMIWDDPAQNLMPCARVSCLSCLSSNGAFDHQSVEGSLSLYSTQD